MNNHGLEKIVEIKCGNCGKGIYIYDEYVREKMFCTLECMDQFKSKNVIP